MQKKVVDDKDGKIIFVPSQFAVNPGFMLKINLKC